MENAVNFEIRIVPAGTGSSVWDDSSAVHMVDRFMPEGRHHGPMIGILHLGQARPTPGVLQSVITEIGENVRAGRYGEFSFVVSSQDSATRDIVSDMARSRDLALFVTTSAANFEDAVPVGSLTEAEHQTLRLVMQAGGTVTASEFAAHLGVEQTTAGNRLVALHKKGYLQRVKRPHPSGDQFLDPRSVRMK